MKITGVISSVSFLEKSHDDAAPSLETRGTIMVTFDGMRDDGFPAAVTQEFRDQSYSAYLKFIELKETRRKVVLEITVKGHPEL